jgi:peptidoglycan-associated lipoprotein
MKKNIITTVLFGLVLAGCQSVPTQDELSDAEDLILIGQAPSPIIISENNVDAQRDAMLSTGEYQTIGSLNLSDDEKAQVMENTTLYFAFDNHELDSDDRKTIHYHIDFLKNHPKLKVIIEGHTDERGEKSYNLTLSEKRATTVSSYMMSQGIEKERMEIVSFGEEKPVSSESSENGWKQNRRASLIYN